MRRWHGWCGLLLASSVLAGSGGQAATLSGQAQDFAGIWDFSIDNSNKLPLGLAGGGPATAVATSKETLSPAVGTDVAGRYSILRDSGKDTGCMLTLESHVKAPGGEKAFLAPGCRDQGIVIFDPVGWQIIGGRLVLTARKGHQTHLDAQPDGTWKKDPKEGKGLSLKKL